MRLKLLVIFFLTTHFASARELSPSVIANLPRNSSLNTKLKQLDDSFIASIECDSKDVKVTRNARVINISSCGSRQMSHLELPKLINDSPFVFVLLIELNEADYDFKAYQQTLSNLLEVDVRRSLLIDYYNKHDDSEEIQVIGVSQEVVSNFIDSQSLRDAMRDECSVCLRLMQLINNPPDFELSERENEDLKCNADCFRVLLGLPFDFNFNGTHVDAYDALHRTHIKSMKRSRVDAQEIKENYTIEEFLSDKENNTKCNALTTLAWKQKRFNIFEFLVRADCSYPQNFIEDRLNSFDYPSDKKFVRKVESHIEKIEKFHKDINSGNLEGVEAFVNAHGGFIFARDTDNRSALKAAFDSKHLKIFSYLKSVGFFFGDYAELADHCRTKNQFKDAKKKRIRQLNRMFTKPARNDVIEKLIDRSLVHYDAKVYTNERIISELRRIYTDLNEFISETLVIAASSSSLEIIFDFDNSDLDDFDPLMGSAYGAAYSFHDYLIISALDLIGDDRDKRNFALGTLAHELFHHVTYQVYGNSFSPYERSDEKRKKKFHKIFQATKLLKNEDSLIKSVFRNGSIEEHDHGELIARIPDILLTNRDNSTYINECRVKFTALFNYYENEVMRDLRAILPIINAREKVREYNEWFNVVAEIQEYEEEENSLEIGNSEDDDGDEHENFIETISNRTNVAFSYFPKRKLAKIYKEANQLKLLAIFVKSSFGAHKNFKKVMFKIDTLYPSVLLVIDCDDLKGLEKFDGILDRTSFERLVAVVDYNLFRKFKRIDFYEDWNVL